MMQKKDHKLVIIVLFFVFLGFCGLFAREGNWEKIDEGLYIGNFESAQKSPIGDSCITIVRINPEFYSFKLVCVKELGLANMTAKHWCKEFGLIAGVNAGMFQTDYQTNVGYMKNFNHLNNPRINSKYKSVFAFNPVSHDKPQARIFDIDEEKMGNIIKDYNSVIQNLRLIKRPGQNRWAKQNKKWSEVALGEDKKGNILFIFCRSPYSMFDFNRILLQLPIDLVCAQHLEGGPEASLYFFHKGIEIEKFGSFETSFNENESNKIAWTIPNVLGIVKKGGGTPNL